MPVRKPPTIAILWDILTEEQKDVISEKFLDWLSSALESVSTKKDALILVEVLRYHSQDLEKVFDHAVKPEFKDLKNVVLEMLVGEKHE